MAIWDYTPKVDLWTGVAIGVGLLAAPVVIPVVAAVVRPVAVTIMRTGLIFYEKSAEMVVEAVDAVGELAEEARAEVEAALHAAR